MRKVFKRTAVFLTGIMLVSSISTTAMAAQDRPDTDRPAAGSSTTIGGNYNFKPSTKYTHSSMKSKITEAQETNKDVAGWLVVPGTNISSAVPYSSKNNDYYMYRDWKGTYHANVTYLNPIVTANYLDSRTKFANGWRNSSRNTVIYGHNWTNLRNPLDIGSGNNHTMFGQLPSYTNKTFAETYPHIYYSTGENEGVWRVFSVAYVELSNNFNYNNPNPKKDDGTYAQLIKDLQKRSMYNFDVDVNDEDRILTLSTCTRVYNAGANQRFIVVARLLRDGESESDTVKVSTNPNVQQPKFS